MATKRVLSVFTLAMINVAAIVSLRTLPMMAEYGLSLVFYFMLAALVFFIPTSLVSAELATGWPQTGGVYIWVRRAFGPRWGFVAIWLQWIENVIWYPTILSFVAATLAYLINPELASNKVYTLSVILVSYWAFTCINFLGMRASGLISSAGVIAGTIIPGALIIVLGFVWLASGKSAQIPLTMHAFVPNLGDLNNVVLLVGVLVGLAGMEMSAVHAQEVRNPHRDYPRAILLSALTILVIFVLGSLAIAIVVPRSDISLVAGVMQAFDTFFTAHGLEWLVVPVGALITAGALAGVSTWIVGPSKGIMATAHHGDLPPLFQRTNKYGMPVPILVTQGSIVTLLALVFLLMPTVSSSYWILTALTAQLYLTMYFLMFIAAIKLRYKYPKHPRAYAVPGGNAGMWIVAGLGALGCLIAIVIGFFPPSQVTTGDLAFYEGFLASGMIVMCIIPLIIPLFRQRTWKSIVDTSEEHT